MTITNTEASQNLHQNTTIELPAVAHTSTTNTNSLVAEIVQADEENQRIPVAHATLIDHAPASPLSNSNAITQQTEKDPSKWTNSDKIAFSLGLASALGASAAITNHFFDPEESEGAYIETFLLLTVGLSVATNCFFFTGAAVIDSIYNGMRNDPQTER